MHEVTEAPGRYQQENGSHRELSDRHLRRCQEYCESYQGNQAEHQQSERHGDYFAHRLQRGCFGPFRDGIIQRLDLPVFVHLIPRVNLAS